MWLLILTFIYNKFTKEELIFELERLNLPKGNLQGCIQRMRKNSENCSGSKGKKVKKSFQCDFSVTKNSDFRETLKDLYP